MDPDGAAPPPSATKTARRCREPRARAPAAALPPTLHPTFSSPQQQLLVPLSDVGYQLTTDLCAHLINHPSSCQAEREKSPIRRLLPWILRLVAPPPGTSTTRPRCRSLSAPLTLPYSLTFTYRSLNHCRTGGTD
ncbi:hypothetical protein PCL_07903 [Purpureocillium lilacinum]|uniref:Uncharacterized protein n=1 Tax=Purpureocillium lilacinum TaxID=33203 RepID=A0A2U3EJA9_PURLI|nr:hypothetical protein PCL_07903 [Purpureocillium lilacinum]